MCYYLISAKTSLLFLSKREIHMRRQIRIGDEALSPPSFSSPACVLCPSQRCIRPTGACTFWHFQIGPVEQRFFRCSGEFSSSDSMPARPPLTTCLLHRDYVWVWGGCCCCAFMSASSCNRSTPVKYNENYLVIGGYDLNGNMARLVSWYARLYGP